MTGKIFLLLGEKSRSPGPPWTFLRPSCDNLSLTNTCVSACNGSPQFNLRTAPSGPRAQGCEGGPSSGAGRPGGGRGAPGRPGPPPGGLSGGGGAEAVRVAGGAAPRCFLRGEGGKGGAEEAGPELGRLFYYKRRGVGWEVEGGTSTSGCVCVVRPRSLSLRPARASRQKIWGLPAARRPRAHRLPDEPQSAS